MMAGNLVKEIADTEVFLRNRGNYADYSDGAVSLRKSLAVSMATQISNLQVLQSSDADALVSATKSLPYGEFTESVAVAIDTRLTVSATATSIKGGKAIQGIMKTPHCYFSTKDVTVFRNPKINMHTKLSVMVSRLNRLGICNPHEQTLRWCLAFVILLHYPDIPSPHEIYAQVQDAKDVVDAERRPYPHYPCVKYPPTPSALSEHVYKYAYDNDDPPTEVHVHGLDNMAINKMVMRKTTAQSSRSRQ